MTGRVLALVCVAAVLSARATALAAPASEDTVYSIARELMCPVCSGQTVAESDSAVAVQMREQIRERLARGETREQILAYFVSQFGEGVLAAPPKRGAGLALWLAPVGVFGVGFVVLMRYLRKITRSRRPAA